MRDRRSLASRVVPEVLDGLRPGDGAADDGRWSLRVLAHSADGPLVLLAERRLGLGPSVSFVVKVADDPAGAVRLDREAAALEVLRAQPGLERWRVAAPTVEAVERRDDAFVLVTSRLSGSRPASRGSAAQRDALRDRALAAIAPLHAATAKPARPDADHAAAWVLGPAARVGAAARHAGMTAAARSVARL